MLRRLAELLSRERIVKRRMPSRLGGDPIFLSPDAALSYWRGNLDACDKDLFDWAVEFVKPGHVVWDVGASMGLFAFAAASIAGSSGLVLALEPDIFSAGVMRKSSSVASRERANVEILPIAASDSVGIEDFNVAARGRSSSFLASSRGSPQAGGVRETVSVVTVTLDWLLERRPAPDVVKIDVEGSEVAVFGGAKRLLSHVKPVILCEVLDENVDPTTAILRANGYRLHDLENRDKGETDRASFNTLALPENPGHGGARKHAL